ncbi:hypothetical protein [Streptomyces sp. A012304]|uniref:hypothetical protein n=1 Tax=Streptomyces sp. A012304 TaxID=375446 RepID=UPI00222E88B5|nr:hypothetical protein [Streptomyces sp. A012304]GKQ38925.1 hypothetical protein ALMP_54540 [Streptomyces sp. A012304]
MSAALAAVRRYAPPLLAHLLIGLPTAVFVLCARWYAAHGHCDLDDLDRRDLDGCTYDDIENSDLVLGVYVVSGVLVTLLLLIYDVLRPLATASAARRLLAPRLLTLPAVFLPYALLSFLAARA